MKAKTQGLLATLLVLALPWAVGAAPAASNQLSDEVVRVTVTAIGHHQETPPPVHKDEVLVYQGKERREVLSWEPVTSTQSGLDLALVIDEATDSSVGVQLADLREFIHSLPATTRVAVGYASNGIVRLTQDFTTDHEKAAEAIRLPLGDPGAFSSVYLSLADLFKRWPEDTNRRAVLLISDGIDLFRGFRDSEPGLNPDLEQAIDLAQREGVSVNTIFTSGAGWVHRNFFLVGNGQGCLSRLAYETGGEAFFQGFSTPVAFRPFLQELEARLGQQYLLAFRAKLGPKADYDRLQVKTEVPGVELIAPEHVYIPPASNQQ